METPYIVLTEDGSLTLFVPEYGQTMHTASGAYSEAVIKHVRPSGVLLHEHSVSVLDIGFGLGYNTLALIREARAVGFEYNINVTALEKDRSYESFLYDIKPDMDGGAEEDLGFIREAFSKGKALRKGISLTVLFGDGRRTASTLTGGFNAVFHDPFSPSKNPELWTVEFFRLIKNLMAKDGVLTTYSSAAQVRAAMHEAGLFIGRGPAMKPKREGTLASIERGCIELFPLCELKALLSDKKAVPYRDGCLSSSQEAILSGRRAELEAHRISLS